MLERPWHYIVAHWPEVLGFIFSLAGVWLTAKEKLINWPVNIVASLIYCYVYYNALLYCDASLQIFFVVMCFYGWYEWKYGGKGHIELPISKSNLKTILMLILITIPVTALLSFIVGRYTPSTTPLPDAFTATLSLVATWMAAKKLIENWLVWIFTDLVYIGLYIYKGLYLTAVLYFIFIPLAIYGYLVWKKQMQLIQSAA